ncbi:MAG: FKBP-type peptidyl-prolyl cis-trans isomerase [Chloroflexota bacterium]|nr:FKBP-type peptidyl-prolyl cis-trans isomerase [Lentimicrobium sp.]
MNYIKLYTIIILILSIGCRKEDNNKEIDDKIIRDYLNEANLSAHKTSSGLYYLINIPGNFPKPSTNSNVTVNYKGYLINHQVFDSTENNNPVTLPMTNVIEGLREGLQLFGEGGKGILFIPSHLGYGSALLPGIPANSILIFEIHLIKVE